MFKNKDFWMGLALGVVAFYVYQNHIKKGGSGA